jgi:serine/threonine protein kinase
MPKHNTRRRGRSLNRNNKRRQTNKRIKSMEPRPKKNNSEEIGSGGFGIVSRPPARCDSFIDKNFNQNAYRAAYYGNPNYISKLTDRYNAERELSTANAIRDEIENYGDYFCLVEFICNAPESKSFINGADYYNTYAISSYCGITLNQYLRDDIINPINVFELCYLVTSLQFLINGLQQLHLKHIYHKDIHDENILVDTNTGQMRLIDFGLSDDLRHIKNDSNPAIIYDEFHDLDYLVKNVIKPLIEFLLNSRITYSKTHIKYPYVEDFYYEIKDFYSKINGILDPYKKKKYNDVDKEEKLIRLLNVVYYFKEIKSIDQLVERYYNNNNNINSNVKQNKKNNQ